MITKSRHQQQVEQFMHLAGQSVPYIEARLDPKTVELRAKLILEECLETVRALGFTLELRGGIYSDPVDLMGNLDLKATREVDLIEVIDGCCDIKVVTTGTLSSFGIPDEAFQTEVDLNNLMKFGPGGYENKETGKWIKPESHQPPKIAEILEVIKKL